MDELNLRFITQNIKSRKMTILLAMVLNAAFFWGLVELLPKSYQSDALIQYKDALGSEQSTGLSGGGLLGGALLGGASIGGDLEMARSLEYLETREFLTSFITDNNMQSLLSEGHWDDDKNAWVPNHDVAGASVWAFYGTLVTGLDVKTNNTSKSIRISFSHSHPKVAQLVLEKFVPYATTYIRGIKLQELDLEEDFLTARFREEGVQSIRSVLTNMLERTMQQKVMLASNPMAPFVVIDKPIVPSGAFWPNILLIKLLAVFSAIILIVTIGLVPRRR